MSNAAEVQSGPDNGGEQVDYSEGDLSAIDSGDDRDYESEGDRRGRRGASSTGQQMNHVRQSAANARAAAVLGSNDSEASQGDVSREGRDLQLATLTKRLENKIKDLEKREAKLAKREHRVESASRASKRSRHAHGRADGDDSAESHGETVLSDVSSDEDGGRHRGSSSNGKHGKDVSLRQRAVEQFDDLGYVDIRVFARANLTVRKTSDLASINTSAMFSAAWASFNVALQEYLIAAGRSTDALMVSKYHSQLIRLLCDYPSQWRLVVELDTYIRGQRFDDSERIVWSIDHNDDLVSQFRQDIRWGHQESSRTAPVLPRLSRAQQPLPTNQRTWGVRSVRGASTGFGTRGKGVCYAWNGENSEGVWTRESHCRGADQCKYAHKCMICGDDHPCYANPLCESQPKTRMAPRRPYATKRA